MRKVRIADLKARLSEHLRLVRKGGTVTVLDRDTPVARIVPYAAESLEIRKATRRPRDLKLPSPRQRFLEILAKAKSNRPEPGNGADIYRRLVEPSNPSFDRTRETSAQVTA